MNCLTQVNLSIIIGNNGLNNSETEIKSLFTSLDVYY